jgi:hypothetical protein
MLYWINSYNMFKLIQSKIKLEFICMCIRGNSFVPVYTILPLYIAAVLLNAIENERTWTWFCPLKITFVWKVAHF